MSRRRTRRDAGRVDPADLPVGPNGRALCRWCKAEVPARRKTFCSNECVHEWKLRTNVTYLRTCTFKRDDGRCAECRTDCMVLAYELKILKRKDPRAWEAWFAENKISKNRTSFWDAHHIIAVADGGGQTGLENIATLCAICHKRITAEQKAARKPASKSPSKKSKKK